MSTLNPGLEADLKALARTAEPPAEFPELSAEQTADGAFRRQRNWFTAHFGTGPDEFPVEPGRYVLAGQVGCGWCRRQLIILRLLGLTDAVPFLPLTGRDEDGWQIAPSANILKKDFGTDRLNDFYRRTDPAFQGRGTSPTVIDTKTGFVVSNNYHLLPHEWETAWTPFHKPGAPDLYPLPLRKEIDLLNQQIFDDINNGTYKQLFAKSDDAALAAKRVFEARLYDLDFRLKSRRYLFGSYITDSDVRLFQTLSSYDRGYRIGIVKRFGEDGTVRITDYPNLWAYARDLFAHDFADELEQYFLRLLPGPSGEYLGDFPGRESDATLPSPAETLAAWQEPSGREHLTGSPFYSGPGGGGSFERWTFR
ncbi:MAG: glutathione S-transferase family protein [Clostridiales Family XIII bacterium]|jgi:putative glutathione S-transferase|nr:glutathione S-transferase family protein [Clostridiales Family XIII bacterium]